MDKRLGTLVAAAAIAVGSGSCTNPPAAPMTQPEKKAAPAGAADTLRIAPDVVQRLSQFPPTAIDYDRSLLDGTETEVLQKLIEASREIDEIYLRQVSEENPILRDELSQAAGRDSSARAALSYFEIMYGPWDRLKGNEAFIGARPKPPGASFYPPDFTKEEFEKWVAAHPGERESFQGLFTVIRRERGGLTAIPYSRVYAERLSRAADRLREAAQKTSNLSLRKYLTSRADAFLTNDYYASDLAWMELDSDIEVIIGPYEVYEDGLFNYKASFESFVTVRDRAESEKLAVYAGHLPDMERNLPIPDSHKNFNRKFESPIKVVQEAFTAGDARRGVQTSAFNLPNDERVREAKGSKKVLLKNVMEAKFHQSGQPVAERVLVPAQIPLVSFDAYFNHTLFHELSHGIGPGVITGPGGEKVESRLLLKNLHSTIEECKADVLGMWTILQAADNGWISTVDEKRLAATVVGLAFRSMRFGIDEAHGGGVAVQWNWFREKGLIEPGEGGRFLVRTEKFREAVRSLAYELLEIEATGDFGRAERLLARYARSTPEIERVIATLNDIPVDIRPRFTAAGEK
ncbi:MAG TPA: peptidase [Thermoanaerobaculia bacterium]